MVNLALNAGVPSAVYWGPEMVILYNDGYRDNIADRHPAALGRSAREVWADLWDTFGERLEAVLSNGTPITYHKVPITLQVEGRMQETFWNFSLSPIYEDARIVGMYKTSQNVTDEVTAFNALALSDERLRLALSATNCLGTLDWHIATDLVFVGERFAQVFGLDPRQLSNGYPRATFLQNVHPDDKQKTMDDAARAIRTGKRFQSVHRVCQPDGSVRLVSGWGSCIYGDDGQPVRFPGIAFDVTEERAEALEQSENSPAILLTSTLGNYGAVTELVEFIVAELVGRKDEVVVSSVDRGRSTHIMVKVATQDVDRLVGENGRTAAAIRSVVAAASIKLGRHHSLEIAGEDPSEHLPSGQMVQ
jgi:PAS domain-containing protein/predicted RNA-binding protein YlqC (UPF0109 family)